MKKSMFVFLLCVSIPLLPQNAWLPFKNETVLKMTTIPGWCSVEKALLMMDVIKENECQCCVEIGVFSGMSLFPIAKALQYNGSGQVFAVDAWDPFRATEGLIPSDPNYIWWNTLDLNFFYQQTLSIIKQNELDKYCSVIKKPSQNAAPLFSEETIDFIHFDGNHNEEFAFQDMIDYFPKVKDGGYILLNDPNWLSMKRSLVFLLERADIISPFSPTATYFLFRKNKQRMQDANILFNDQSFNYEHRS